VREVSQIVFPSKSLYSEFNIVTKINHLLGLAPKLFNILDK
jgi:hypothetical protein